MPSASVIISAVLAAASAMSSVDAQGYISSPKAQFKQVPMYTNYSAIITEADDKVFKGKVWDQSPEDNTKVFTEAFTHAPYTSLKEMFDKYITDCGYSRDDVAPVDVTNLDSMTWQNDEYEEGFLSTHHGPCEVWFDDFMIVHEDDCAAKYSGFPATIPLDYSICPDGKCLLSFYWLTLQAPEWQAYKQCVPIKYGAGNGSSGDEATPEPSTATPKPSTAAPTKTPTPTTSVPKSSSATPSTTAPAAGTPSPNTKCGVRRS
ncbi:hypothetical protein Poli38472_002992 [Pythium oligandrum]|uniref:Uncharacterized protein n=1 Tax=Pythium oligandrum TaxID=41045 RepID=A0A8K1C5U0_PYTOL|nr:hypothetical protein Poli38472_002992 [Pythium oligandrum]|eukprot:TMW57067.1 hypothetical protein Poli38472_002992 [Pythium oligandrum]